MRFRYAPAILVVMLSACGSSSGSTPGPQQPEPRSKTAARERKSGPVLAPNEPSAPKPPPGTLFREDVLAVVQAGLGLFLQRVEVEPSFGDDGRFQGFRIVKLLPPSFWQGVDLKPGDVVQRVNGLPIERETEAYDAFQTLRTSEELRVSYLRAGAPRELVYKITPRPK